MNKKNLKKESIRENYRIFEYDDGSIEEIFDISLLKNTLSDEEEAKIQEQSNISIYRTLSKSDKQNLNLESQLSYISTLLEYLVSNIK